MLINIILLYNRHVIVIYLFIYVCIYINVCVYLAGMKSVNAEFSMEDLDMLLKLLNITPTFHHRAHSTEPTVNYFDLVDKISKAERLAKVWLRLTLLLCHSFIYCRLQRPRDAML